MGINNKPDYVYDTADIIKDKKSTTLQELREANIKAKTKSEIKNLKAEVITNDTTLAGRLRLREKVTQDNNDKVLYRLSNGKEVTILSNEIFKKTIDGVKRNFVKVQYKKSIGYLPEEYLRVEDNINNNNNSKWSNSGESKTINGKVDEYNKNGTEKQLAKPGKSTEKSTDKQLAIPGKSTEESTDKQLAIPGKSTEESTDKQLAIPGKSDISNNKIENEKYETTKYEIETSPDGYSMLGANGEKVYYSKPSLERTNLKGDSLKRYEQLSKVLDIWNSNAIKVSVNDAFMDSTKANIKKAVLSVSKLIKKSNNDVFLNNKKYKKLVDNIFKIIIKTEDDERDIIDEEDMEEVKKLLLNGNLDKSNMLKIYETMRNSLGIFDDGDSSEIKEKIGEDLLETKDFEYIKDFTNSINNIKGELTQNELDKIINSIPNKNKNFELRNDIQDARDNLAKAYREQTKNIEKNYNKFLTKNGLDRSVVTMQDYKDTILKATFARNIKHILLKDNLDKSAYRGNEDTSLKGKYADIIGLAENKGYKDYLDIADSNIDWTKEVGLTIATSLIPAIGAYSLSVKAVNAGLKAYNGMKLGRVGNFALRNTAAYSASIAYEGIKDNNYGELWNTKSLGEFMLMDGILSGAMHGVKFIKKGNIYKIKDKTVLNLGNKYVKAAAYTAGGIATADAMINVSRAMQGKEIVLNPGDWSKDDLSMVAMFVAMHGVGKYIAKRGTNGKIGIEYIKPNNNIKSWSTTKTDGFNTLKPNLKTRPNNGKLTNKTRPNNGKLTNKTSGNETKKGFGQAFKDSFMKTYDDIINNIPKRLTEKQKIRLGKLKDRLKRQIENLNKNNITKEEFNLIKTDIENTIRAIKKIKNPNFS